MSADTSDPALRQAVSSVHDAQDPASWLVAHYAQGSTSKIVLVDSGRDPALPRLRPLLDAPDCDATFAYATVQNKGLVLLRLADGVGGVKRAKAIVHTRAFAALFPDYLALVTLTSAGALTDELVADRLGLKLEDLAVPPPPPPPEEKPGLAIAPSAVPAPEPAPVAEQSAVLEDGDAVAEPQPSSSAKAAVAPAEPSGTPPAARSVTPEVANGEPMPSASAQPAPSSASSPEVSRAPSMVDSEGADSALSAAPTNDPAEESVPEEATTTRAIATTMPTVPTAPRAGSATAATAATLTTPSTSSPRADPTRTPTAKAAATVATQIPPTHRALPPPRLTARQLAAAALLEADTELPELPMPTPSDEGSEFSFYRTNSRSQYDSTDDSADYYEASPEMPQRAFQAQPPLPAPSLVSPVSPVTPVTPVMRNAVSVTPATPVSDVAAVEPATPVTRDVETRKAQQVTPIVTTAVPTPSSPAAASPLPPIPARAAARDSPRESPSVAEFPQAPSVRSPSTMAPPRPPRASRTLSPNSSPIPQTPTSPPATATVVAPSQPAVLEADGEVDDGTIPPPNESTVAPTLESGDVSEVSTASETPATPEPVAAMEEPTASSSSDPSHLQAVPDLKGSPEAPYSPSSAHPSSPGIGESPDFDGYRPPSRNASVPASVTSESRRSSRSQSRSRRGSDPSTSPESRVSRRYSRDANVPSMPPLPPALSASALRRTSRGEARNPSVPQSPVSAGSPLAHSPHSRRGSSGQLPPPLPVPDEPVPPLPQQIQTKLQEGVNGEYNKRSSYQHPPLPPIPASVKEASAEMSSLGNGGSPLRDRTISSPRGGVASDNQSSSASPMAQAVDKPLPSGQSTPSTIRVQQHTPMAGNRAPPPAPVTVPPVVARAVHVQESPKSSGSPVTPGTASTAVASPTRKRVPAYDPEALTGPTRASALSHVVNSPDLESSSERGTTAVPSPSTNEPFTTSTAIGQSTKSSPVPDAVSPSAVSKTGDLPQVKVDQSQAPRLDTQQRGSARLVGLGFSGLDDGLAKITQGDLHPAPVQDVQDASLPSPLSFNSTFSSPRSQYNDVAELGDVGSTVSLVDAQVATARVVSMSNGHARRMPSVDLKTFAQTDALMNTKLEKGGNDEEHLDAASAATSDLKTLATRRDSAPSVSSDTDAVNASPSAEPAVKRRDPSVDISEARPRSRTSAAPESRIVSSGTFGRPHSGAQSALGQDSMASGSSRSSMRNDTRPMSMVSERRPSLGELRPMSEHSDRADRRRSMGIFDVTEEVDDQLPQTVLLNSGQNTPLASSAATVPVISTPASITPTPNIDERLRHGPSQTSLSSKFRIPFLSPRSPRTSTAPRDTATSPYMDDDDSSLSPSQRLRTASWARALNLRRSSGPTSPGSPRTRSRVGSRVGSDDTHTTLPLKETLHGLGLSNLPGLSSLAQAPSAYRTPTGGIGFSPSPTHSPIMTAEAALAQARERSLAEQSEAYEAYRRRESERARSRTSAVYVTNEIDTPHHLHRGSTYTSDMVSDESHLASGYDDQSDELPQTLSLAIVTNAGEKPRSPVEQLSASASAVKMARHKDRPLSSPDTDKFHTPTNSFSASTKLSSPRALTETDMNLDRDLPPLPPQEKQRVKVSEKAAVSTVSVAAPEDAVAERERLEAEEEEAARVAKAEADRKEAERVEAERREAERLEAERVEAERKEAERVAAEKAEAERVAAAKAEAERIAAEKAEAERLAAIKAEEERKAKEQAAREAEAKRLERLEAVRKQVHEGKASGGVMLRGWVTVQTMQSYAWRRRFFHLLSSEMKLFKSDKEGETPLTVAKLTGASVSRDYEESQVRGSWKLKDGGGEEYFMFADSADDRDIVLEVLGIAIGE